VRNIHRNKAVKCFYYFDLPQLAEDVCVYETPFFNVVIYTCKTALRDEVLPPFFTELLTRFSCCCLFLVCGQPFSARSFAMSRDGNSRQSLLFSAQTHSYRNSSIVDRFCFSFRVFYFGIFLLFFFSSWKGMSSAHRFFYFYIYKQTHTHIKMERERNASI